MTKPNSLGHKFEIGEAYANRRGNYEVIRIDDDSGKMWVRYLDNDDEIELTVATQLRIWQNMSGEQRAVARKKAEESERFARALGRDFEGLEDTDFRSSVDGTHWRSRQSLGGRVARLLGEKTPLPFVSLPVYRWPVVFLTHRERAEMASFDTGAPLVKFNIEVDEAGVYYGLYVERDPTRTDAEWDWQRLMKALTEQQDLRETIARLEDGQGMSFIGRTSSGTEHFHYRNGLSMGSELLWDAANESAIPMTDRIQRLAGIRDGWWGEIYLVASQSKEQAIASGEELAESIAALMAELLSIYTAAAGVSRAETLEP